MPSVGMLRGGPGAACLLVLMFGYAYALPLQLLPEIPGYIPVYIRHGDEPLEDISPGLAEAFHENTGHSKNVRQIQLDRRQMTLETGMASSSEEDGNAEKSRERIAPPLKSFAVNGLHEEGSDMIAERLGRRTPIEVPKNSVLKEAEVSEAEERKLVNLAAEIEREETKPNDLYDTNISNPLYSSPEMNERHGTSRSGSSTKLRLVSNWSPDGTKEAMPEVHGDMSEEGSFSFERGMGEKEEEKEEEEEEKKEKVLIDWNDGKVNNRNYEFGSNGNAKDSEEGPEERIRDPMEESE